MFCVGEKYGLLIVKNLRNEVNLRININNALIFLLRSPKIFNNMYFMLIYAQCLFFMKVFLSWNHESAIIQ